MTNAERSNIDHSSAELLAAIALKMQSGVSALPTVEHAAGALFTLVMAIGDIAGMSENPRLIMERVVQMIDACTQERWGES